MPYTDNTSRTLQWRHNGHDGVSYHQRLDGLLNRLFRPRQSSASLAFVRGIHRWPVNSPHKWPVTRKMLPFDDAIMILASFFHMYKFVYLYAYVHCYIYTPLWFSQCWGIYSRLTHFRVDYYENTRVLHRTIIIRHCWGFGHEIIFAACFARCLVGAVSYHASNQSRDSVRRQFIVCNSVTIWERIWNK